jgi:anti-sigma regulatory factor (Ser/Thr protein kinase)
MPISTLREKDFLGRSEELSDLYRWSLDVERGIARRIFLAGARGIGKTELLSQLYNRLFWTQDRVAPFYYSANNAILCAADFSKDYFTQFLCQRLAFEKKEQSLLSLDGLSIKGLSSLAQERNAAWANTLLERFIHCSGEPIEALRIALGAPHQSALATGKPVVLMVDEFHKLKGLRRDMDARHELVSLFEEPLSSLRTAWVITGSVTELQEMAIAASLTRFNLFPLNASDAASLLSSLLGRHGIERETPPPGFHQRLGGNPLYFKHVAAAASSTQGPDGLDFWSVYVREVMEGGIHGFWSAHLKQHFPTLDARRRALEILNIVYHAHAGGPLTRPRIAADALHGAEKEKDILDALQRADFLSGEFGTFSAPEDRVLRDVVNALTLREIQGKSLQEVEQELIESLLAPEKKFVSFEMILPAMKDTELVAAQCLEQIGKNLRLSQEVIGQLQMALIEACINAMKYGGGEKKKVFVRIYLVENRIAISVESFGWGVTLQEDGETSAKARDGGNADRRWGMKLMKNFVDEVRFEKTAQGTRVVLIKNLRKSPETRIEGGAGTA